MIKKEAVPRLKRRVAIMRLDMNSFVRVLREGSGFFVDESPLKGNVSVVGIHQNMLVSPGNFDVILEGDEFDEVEEGALMPVLDRCINISTLVKED